MFQQITNTCIPVSWLVMGMLDNNVYVADDGEGCFIVDPSCDAERIMEVVGDRQVDAIVLTHGHWDHTGAAADLRKITNAPVIASELDAPVISGETSFGNHIPHNDPCPVDRLVNDGDTIDVGTAKLQVIATPGHTPGGISIFVEPTVEGQGAPVLFSGDTLFAGTHGRVDFDEGDIDKMRESLIKLASLPGETVVLPGHSGLTTIARESGWLKLCCI